MSDLKNKLIPKINTQTDEDLLRDIYALLVNEEQESIHFTEEQQSKTRESEEAYNTRKPFLTKSSSKNSMIGSANNLDAPSSQ